MSQIQTKMDKMYLDFDMSSEDGSKEDDKEIVK
jgi:hypothetical protein